MRCSSNAVPESFRREKKTGDVRFGLDGSGLRAAPHDVDPTVVPERYFRPRKVPMAKAPRRTVARIQAGSSRELSE